MLDGVHSNAFGVSFVNLSAGAGHLCFVYCFSTRVDKFESTSRSSTPL